MFTIQQTSERLAVSVSTVKRLVRSGRLPAVKLTPGSRGAVRVTEQALRDFEASNVKGAAAVVGVDSG